MNTLFIEQRVHHVYFGTSKSGSINRSFIHEIGFSNESCSIYRWIVSTGYGSLVFGFRISERVEELLHLLNAIGVINLARFHKSCDSSAVQR